MGYDRNAFRNVLKPILEQHLVDLLSQLTNKITHDLIHNGPPDTVFRRKPKVVQAILDQIQSDLDTAITSDHMDTFCDALFDILDSRRQGSVTVPQMRGLRVIADTPRHTKRELVTALFATFLDVDGHDRVSQQDVLQFADRVTEFGFVVLRVRLKLLGTLGRTVIGQVVTRVFDHFVKGESGLTQNRLEQLKMLGPETIEREFELAFEKALGLPM